MAQVYVRVRRGLVDINLPDAPAASCGSKHARLRVKQQIPDDCLRKAGAEDIPRVPRVLRAPHADIGAGKDDARVLRIHFHDVYRNHRQTVDIVFPMRAAIVRSIYGGAIDIGIGNPEMVWSVGIWVATNRTDG